MLPCEVCGYAFGEVRTWRLRWGEEEEEDVGEETRRGERGRKERLKWCL